MHILQIKKRCNAFLAGNGRASTLILKTLKPALPRQGKFPIEHIRAVSVLRKMRSHLDLNTADTHVENSRSTPHMGPLGKYMYTDRMRNKT